MQEPIWTQYLIFSPIFSDVAVYFHCTGHGKGHKDTLIGWGRQIVFTVEALVTAKNNFHDTNKLGEGGFGLVYKTTITKNASNS